MPGVCDVSHVDAISNIHDYVIDSCKIAMMMYMYISHIQIVLDLYLTLGFS